jgi:hypothetical protein
MAVLPTKTNLIGTPTTAVYKSALGALYDVVAEEQTLNIAHRANKENPHNVTATQVGAIASTLYSATPAANKLYPLNSSGKYPATLISSVPAGELVSTTIQDAVNELDTKKASITQAKTLFDKAHSFAAAGYQRFENGWIIQWGTTTSGGRTVFPLQFPTAVLIMNIDYSVNVESSGLPSGPKAGYVVKNNLSVTGCDVKFRWPAYTHDNGTGDWREVWCPPATYIAIGY